jgi:hypothetical protein
MRQPIDFLPRQKSHRENPFCRLRRPTRSLGRRVSLQQGKARMVEKSASRGG